MTAGLAVVLNHNIWVLSWQVLITLSGWLATFGGAARMAMPNQARKIAAAMHAEPRAIQAAGFGWAVAGALLCFFGYIRS